jgi:preprotein translocase subunit SecY
MIIMQFFPEPKSGIWKIFRDLSSTQSPLYMVLYFLLIVGFSFFYAFAQFNPVEISNNMKSNGGFIPGLRPGKPTSDFISKVMRKITIIGALFLAAVAITPILVSLGSSTLSGLALGGTTVLIVVGVALDTVKQLEAQMIMRHHKGFLE